VQIAYCPRCGTQRMDDLPWCRRCALDFEEAERGHLPPPTSGTVERIPPQAPSHWQLPGQPPLIDVRPVSDRRTMARVAGQSLTVSCGGTVGGCAGMVVGLVAGVMVGFALGGWAAIVLAPIGMILGLFGGMRLALELMAH
jgi:hypothetical protein